MSPELVLLICLLFSLLKQILTLPMQCSYSDYGWDFQIPNSSWMALAVHTVSFETQGHAQSPASLSAEPPSPSSSCYPQSFPIPQLSSHHRSPCADSASPLELICLLRNALLPLLCFPGPNIFIWFYFICLLSPSTGWQLFYHLQQEMLSLLCRQNICKGAGGTQKAVGNW